MLLVENGVVHCVTSPHDIPTWHLTWHPHVISGQRVWDVTNQEAAFAWVWRHQNGMSNAASWLVTSQTAVPYYYVSLQMYLLFLSDMIFSMVTLSFGLKRIITPRLWLEPWLSIILPPHSACHALLFWAEEYVSCKNITSDFCWYIHRNTCSRLVVLFNPLMFNDKILSSILPNKRVCFLLLVCRFDCSNELTNGVTKYQNVSMLKHT